MANLPEPVTREEIFLKAIADNGGGGGGTTDYEQLTNLPKVNGVELKGNKSASQLGLQDALTFDDTPTKGSTNPVTSGGVFNELNTINSKYELRAIHEPVTQSDTWETIFEGQTGDYMQLVSAATGYNAVPPTGLRICDRNPENLIYSCSTKEDLGSTRIVSCPAVLIPWYTTYIVQRRYRAASSEGSQETTFVSTIKVG